MATQKQQPKSLEETASNAASDLHMLQRAQWAIAEQLAELVKVLKAQNGGKAKP